MARLVHIDKPCERRCGVVPADSPVYPADAAMICQGCKEADECEAKEAAPAREQRKKVKLVEQRLLNEKLEKDRFNRMDMRNEEEALWLAPQSASGGDAAVDWF